MRGAWAARLALFVASLVASLALVFAFGEAALRLSFGSARSYRLSEIVRFHPELGWALRPGEYDYFNPAAFSRARFTIGEPGIRSAPAEARAAPARARVALVGDSFVFSEALSDGETAADQLQQILGPSCEVVNLGVPGYGTGQELLWLDELHARGFEIGETLVLAFFTNDVADNSALRYGTFERDPQQPAFSIERGEVVHTRPEPFPVQPAADGGARGWFGDSLLENFLRRRAEVLAAQSAGVVTLLANLGYKVELPRTPGIIPAWYGRGWEERWALTEELLRRLARRASAWGVRDFRVVFVPSPFQVEEVFLRIAREQRDGADYDAFLSDVERPQRLLLDFCARDGLACHDLTPALKNTDSPAFFLREGHLNPQGSRLFAEALAGWLGGGCGSARPGTPLTR